MHGIGVLTPSTASKRRLCSPRTRGEANRIPFSRRSRARAMPRHSRNRHCEEPTGPARSGRPDDRLRDEAIQRGSARYFVVQRNGTAELDCFAALAMTKEKRKQNADRRVILPSASCDAARALCLFSSPEIGEDWEGRARLSAFHHGACCSERTPQLSSRYALPGTWSGRTIPNVRTTWFERPRAFQRMIRKSGCRFSGKIMRQLNGRYPLLPVPVQRASRRPVIVPAGRIFPEPPGSGGDEPPPAGTALAPPAGVAGWRPLRERDSLDGS